MKKVINLVAIVILSSSASVAQNATTWNVQEYDPTINDNSLNRLMGYNATQGKWTYYTAPIVRSFLGIPSGGDNLQSVCERGNVTPNWITVGSTSSGHINLRPGGNANAGYMEFYKGDGNTRLGYIGYNNDNIEYSAEGGNHIFTHGSIGLGTPTPYGKLNIIHEAQNAEGNSLVIGPVMGTNLRLGYNTTYSWIQAHGGMPLHINDLGNDLILNHTGGSVGIGTANPVGKFDLRGAAFIGNNNVSIGATGSFLQIDQGVSTGNSYSQIRAYSDGGNSLDNLVLQTNGGSVGIGTTSPGDHRLAVEGTIGARKVRVTQETWPDYVFDTSYQLTSLVQVEQYIQQNKHLPDVPSTVEVEKNGLDLGDNQAILLRKIEELTLYIIQQNKELKSLAAEVKTLKKEK